MLLCSGALHYSIYVRVKCVNMCITTVCYACSSAWLMLRDIGGVMQRHIYSFRPVIHSFIHSFIVLVPFLGLKYMQS